MVADDLVPFFSVGDLAVLATWRPAVGEAQETCVLFDAPDHDLFAGVVQARAYKITYPATIFATLKAGDTIEIDTIQYTVLGAPDAIDDGALMRASLSRK
ncbi:MAG: head-tail joining protein [Gammaproteobacteria bacterium]